MGGHVMMLAAFFVQSRPPALALREVVTDVHVHRGRDPSEGVDQEGDQRAIAQSDWRRHIDAVEELPRFVIGQDRRLAFFYDVLGPAHRGSRVHLDDLAHHQPVEQHANRRKVLFDRRRTVLLTQELDIGRHVMRPQRLECQMSDIAHEDSLAD
jgi:hypothetical protein